MVINIAELIEQNRIGWFQVRIFALCAGVSLLDGYDTLIIGFTALPIAAELKISTASLAPVFASAQMGFIVGAFLLAPFGDRLGRKPVLILGVLIFSICSTLVVFTSSLSELVICRFATGIGLGTATPLFVSLGADYAPTRVRGTVLTLLYLGIPLGGVVGGVLSSLLIDNFGWRILYWVALMAAVPLALLLLALPESLPFLIGRDKGSAKIRKIVKAIAPTAVLEADTTFALPAKTLPGASVKYLFTQGMAGSTLLLWGAFCSIFFVLYVGTTWPAALLKEAGVPAARAALVASFFAGGGIPAALGTGYLVDRFGPSRVLGLGAVAAALSVASLGFAASSFALSCAAFLIAGITVGSVVCGMVVLSSHVYPTAIRSTGVGWAFGIGRIAGVLGPLVVGTLVASGWNIQNVFVACAAPALLCSAFIVLLQWRQRRHGISQVESPPLAGTQQT